MEQEQRQRGCHDRLDGGGNGGWRRSIRFTAARRRGSPPAPIPRQRRQAAPRGERGRGVGIRPGQREHDAQNDHPAHGLEEEHPHRAVARTANRAMSVVKA